MLTQAQLTQFQRDGYTAVRNAIDPYTLSKLQAAADAWLDKSRKLTASTTEIELDDGHSAAEPKLRRLNHPVTLDSIFWETASSDAVLDCVEGAIGPNIKFHHSKLNMKASKGGAAIGWHQDFAFFPHTNDDLVACGIALDDCVIENGCLLVVPDTHRLGLLNHFGADNQFKGKITSDMDKFDEKKNVPVELKAGDMSIHHVCAVHGSTQNNSGRARRLLIFQYAATDAVQLDYRVPPNAFANRIVRGAPLTHARLNGAKSLRLRGPISATASIFAAQKTETYG